MVTRSPTPPRPFFPARLAGLGAAWLLCLVGCSTAPETPRLATTWREAEVAVSNLTPYPWRLALRSPQGAEVKTVEVRPRESLAVVVAGGEYVIEQTLVAPDPAVAKSRSFTARFEAGERYRWSLATLLSAEEVVAP